MMRKQLLTFALCATTLMVAGDRAPNKQLAQAITAKDTWAIINALQQNVTPNADTICSITNTLNPQSTGPSCQLYCTAGLATVIYAFSMLNFYEGNPWICGGEAIVATGVVCTNYDLYQNPPVILTDEDKALLTTLKTIVLAENPNQNYCKWLTDAHTSMQKSSSREDFETNRRLFTDAACCILAKKDQ